MNKNSGFYKNGKSHAEGGIPVLVDGSSPIEVEQFEYKICNNAMNSTKTFEFKNKTNKEILDDIFQYANCEFEENKANSGDFIICKLAVMDKNKRNITGTVKEIINVMQSEKSCNVTNDSKFKDGGSINNTNLLAPNGKPSNLNEVQYNLVRTKEFKAWFGDWINSPKTASKIVDENKEPKVMYSGSPNEFTIFETDEIEVDRDDREYKSRFWFIENKKNAEDYSRKATGNIGSIYECFLNIRNPKYDFNLYTEDNQDGSVEFLNKKIWVAIATNSNQIKLADGTNTTFDGSNDDIRYAKGGEVNDETYTKWKNLVNMSKSELQDFYNSKDGKEAGLSSSEAKEQGISSGRESARWIMKMKDTPKSEWTPTMWKWANKQISFISRMSGMKGDLYDDKGNKTRKHTSLLIWGHNPKKYKDGGILEKRNLTYIGEVGGHNLDIDKNSGFINVYDGKKRYELSDNDIALLLDFDDAKNHCLNNKNTVFTTIIGKVIKHDLLFKAYPEIKDIKFSFYYNENKKQYATYYQDENKILYNFYGEEIYLRGRDTSRRTRLQVDSELRAKVLLHEIQHFIQRIETMAKGSSIFRELRELCGFDNRCNRMEDVPIDLQNLYLGEATRRYNMSAGELEANDTMNRINLTDEERKQIKPFGLDKDDEVIVKLENGGELNANDCAKYIKENENVFKNGYYSFVKNMSIYADSYGGKIPKINSLIIISYNSGGQNNLKVTDTINSSILQKQIGELIEEENGIPKIIISKHLLNAKRVNEDIFNLIKNNNVVIIDGDEVVCYNIKRKFNTNEITVFNETKYDDNGKDCYWKTYKFNDSSISIDYCLGDFFKIDAIGTKEKSRRSGDASKLIAYVKEIAVKNNFQKIDVYLPIDENTPRPEYTLEDYKKAVSFYKKNGFEFYTNSTVKMFCDLNKILKNGGELNTNEMKTEIKNWKKFVLENKTWFDNESDNSSDEILLTTRENGNIYNEEVGQKDIDEAKDIAKKVISKFPKTQYNIERVDEYVYLYLRPNKTDKELEQEKSIKKIKDEQDKYAKIITEKLNIPNEKALEIIKSFSYSKEYYEKNKNKNADNYDNTFRVYFSIGSPSSVYFDNAEQVFDYISKDDFIKSIYNRSNPRNEVSIALYGWGSLKIKYDNDGRPVLPNGDTDWSRRGKVLMIHPFIETNIENEKDFIDKVKKTISDFIISYKIYVLNNYKFDKDLAKGIEVESEHKATAEKLYNQEITPEQAAESIAKEHLAESPDYYKELDKMEEKLKNTKMEINTNIVTNWDEVPKVWRNIEKVKKVNFVNSPYNKDLIKLITPFTGDDNLRPIMSGIHFDENGITATDAHKLINLPYPNKDFNGTYATVPKKFLKDEKSIENDLFSDKYPNYKAVIPTSDKAERVQEISVYKLLQYTEVAVHYANQSSKQVAFSLGDIRYGLNGEFLIEVLKTALKLGHEKLYAFTTLANRGIVFSDNKNYELGKDLIILQMPLVLLNDYEHKGKKYDSPLGAQDLDWDREITVYYDFSKDAIVNQDGSIAEFKMNYGEYDVLPPNEISVLKNFQGKNNTIPVLDYFKVQGNKVLASNLETFITIKNTNLKDGLYQIRDNAVEFDPTYTLSSYEEYPNPRDRSEKRIEFSINSDVLLHYVKIALEYNSDDELRPVMTGILFDYNQGKMYIVSTDAHKLLKINITEFIEIDKDQKDFQFILSENNLLKFLDNVDDSKITISSTKELAIFENDEFIFESRLIDGKYPAYNQVISAFKNKKLTINIKDLFNCIKSKEAETFIKSNKGEDILIYDKLKSESELSINLGFLENKKIEKSIEICKVDYKLENGDYQTKDSLVLLMPIMGDNENENFMFNYKFLKTVLETLNCEDVELFYDEKNRAYVFGGDCFGYESTIKAKKKEVTKKSIEPKTEIKEQSSEQKEFKEAINTFEELIKLGGTDAEIKEFQEAIETFKMLI